MSTQQVQSPPVAPQQSEPTQSPHTSGLSVLLFYIVIAVLIALYNDKARPVMIGFIGKYRWILLAVAVLAVALGFFGRTRKWVGRFTVRGRIALVVFVGAPFVLFLAGLAVYFPPAQAVAYLRGIFLITVCLLPAVLYYLFISTRKNGLLNEYIINLGRLGFLPSESANRETADDAFRRARLQAYMQKFEAVYGPLPDPSLKQLDASSRIYSNPTWLRSASAGLGDILTAETAIPVIIATLLIVLGWLPVLPPRVQVNVNAESETVEMLRQAFIPGATPILFGFLGAYFFSLQMLFRRFVRRDLSSNAYVATSMRIIVAVIGTLVMEDAVRALRADVDVRTLEVMGFIIGFFPMVLWQVLASVIKKITFASYFLPSMASQLPVSDLDGLTYWHQARLEEEDIENIPNMSTADIVDIMLATRVPPDRIVDWVDQAILYTHLGPEKENGDKGRRERLRQHGIRTASALIEAYRHSIDRKLQEQFRAILETPNGQPPTILTLIDAVRTNPNLAAIQTWRRLSTELPVETPQPQPAPLAAAAAAHS
jgi:hypothetical protein